VAKIQPEIHGVNMCVFGPGEIAVCVKNIADFVSQNTRLPYFCVLRNVFLYRLKIKIVTIYRVPERLGRINKICCWQFLLI
jgi:hypothetical protein